MAGPAGRNASHRETETENRFWLSFGILFTASFAGGIWATVVSSNYYAFWDGVALGLLVGATLVMTAPLASMRPHSESWIREKSSFR
ncbi:hypothetical protein AUI06_06090 [archaeon 13_2_20CM_2_52_21]|nr:MAG: hypothetical protein AUI06_06090 [archaeon 13_2_20CM_2_52_21]